MVTATNFHSKRGEMWVVNTRLVDLFHQLDDRRRYRFGDPIDLNSRWDEGIRDDEDMIVLEREVKS